jgi:hypothetical protein
MIDGMIPIGCAMAFSVSWGRCFAAERIGQNQKMLDNDLLHFASINNGGLDQTQAESTGIQ